MTLIQYAWMYPVIPATPTTKARIASVTWSLHPIAMIRAKRHQKSQLTCLWVQERAAGGEEEDFGGLADDLHTREAAGE